MKKKEDRRITMTKRMLKNALIELLKEKDIYRISIRELCDRADINRSTFYKYYGSQFDLFSEMEDEMITMFNETMSESPDLEFCVTTICRYMEQNLEFSRLLINNSSDAAFPEKLYSQKQLQQLIADGLDDELDEQELEYTCRCVVYGCYQIIRVWLNKENREPPEVIASIFRKTFRNIGNMIL